MSYRVRFTLPDGRSWVFDYQYATREEAQRALDKYTPDVMGATYTIFGLPEASTAAWQEDRVRAQEAQIASLRSELAQLRDAYDAARQDLDVAKRNVARLESTLDMVQASWAVSVASADVARAASAEAHRKAVVSVVRLDRALALGDAMHRAHPSEDWAEYKDSLAALRQGPAKASEAPGEGQDSGEGEK